MAHSTSPDLAHPDWPALYSAVLAAPEKDPPRRAAAVWLWANGDPDRAAFILAQSRTGKDVERHSTRVERQARARPSEAVGGTRPRSHAQLDRDNESYDTERRLAKHVGQWYARGTNGMDLIDINPKGWAGVCGVPERGFVSWVLVVNLERWWEVGVNVRRDHPVCRVTVRTDPKGRPFRPTDDPVRKEEERVLGETALKWARWAVTMRG